MAWRREGTAGQVVPSNANNLETWTRNRVSQLRDKYHHRRHTREKKPAFLFVRGPQQGQSDPRADTVRRSARKGRPSRPVIRGYDTSSNKNSETTP